MCGSYQARGRCRYNWVFQDVIFAIVAAKVRQYLLRGSQAELEAEIEKSLAKRKAPPKVDVASVRKDIANIDRKLAAAAERIMDVDPSLVKTMESKMLELQDQREALMAKLEALPSKKSKPLSAKELAAKAWRLDDVLRNGSPSIIRNALSQLITRIDLRFTEKAKQIWTGIPGGGRGSLTNKVAGGMLHFANAPILACPTVRNSRAVGLVPTVRKITSGGMYHCGLGNGRGDSPRPLSFLAAYVGHVGNVLHLSTPRPRLGYARRCMMSSTGLADRLQRVRDASRRRPSAPVERPRRFGWSA